MCIDLVVLFQEVIYVVCNQVVEFYGFDYILDKLCIYVFKVKNVQEVYEVIWFVGEYFCILVEIGLIGDEFRFYELVWMCILVF